MDLVPFRQVMPNELLNPLHLSIALGPLAVYLLLLGAINLSARPLITTGSRDVGALGVGLCGLAVMGPLQLLLPSATVFHLGPWVWLLVLALYGLCLTLTVLLMRPRLILYNMPEERVRPLLASLVNELDPESRWAGECLSMPTLGIQLHIETSGAMRNVQLVSAGPRQSYEGWRRLQTALTGALRQTRSERHPLGLSMLMLGLLILGGLTMSLVSDPQAVAQAVHEMLRAPAGE